MKITSCLLFLFLLTAACSSRFNQQTEEQLSDAELDSLRQVYYYLNDTLEYTWESMMEDEDNRLQDMQLLLNEIRKTDTYAVDSLDSLSQMLGVLRLIRYDSTSVGDPNLINRYDSLSRRTSETLVRYAETLPDAMYDPAINILIDRVLAASSSAVLYRLSYDKFINDFNFFLEKYKNVMANIDSSGNSAYKRPAFRLVNDYQEEQK
jgi:hypothetical protein